MTERSSGELHATDGLLGRIASILDAARGQVVRVVNHATVLAYWHIGREMVEALQQGEERATYGKALIERLARQLTERYGKGFSATNLGYFRQFYLAYRDRTPHPAGEESQRSAAPSEILHPVGGESLSMFHPNLSWSHYRALMRVTDAEARRFYEAEAVCANGSRRELERQISVTIRPLRATGCFDFSRLAPIVCRKLLAALKTTKRLARRIIEPAMALESNHKLDLIY